MTQVGVLQVTALEIDSEQHRTGEVGVPEADTRQLSIRRWAARRSTRDRYSPGASRGSGRRPSSHTAVDTSGDRCSSHWQPVINCCRRVLGPVGRADHPGCVAADERRENSRDGISVGWRVLGDALQGEDATQPHIRRLAAELVDGTGKPLGDLSFTVDLNLAPRGDGTHDQEETGHALEQGGAGIVLQSGLGLLKLHAPVGAGYVSQIACGQRGMSQPRNTSTQGQQQRNATAIASSTNQPATARTSRRLPSSGDSHQEVEGRVST